uniref:PRA1 family protein n=1 Tax=Clastoptera arizonana TaxID=38151 RepID=A0A1B6CTJ3_9HEMI
MTSKDIQIDVSGEMASQTMTNKPTGRLAQTLSLKAWLLQCRQNIRPWATFFNTTNFNIPPSVPQVTKRLLKNVAYFQSNYFIIFLLLALYCLITSPLLLIAVAASLGACYLLSARNAESKITIMNHELTLAQQYALVAGISLPIYLLAGAGSAIFWTIGATVVVIGIHSAFYNFDAIEQKVEQDHLDSILEQI